MGWTYYRASYFKNGKIDRKAECDAEFTGENYEVVKSRLVGSTWYAAIKDKRTDEVWGLVCLTSVDGWDFGYKDMFEDMGPFCYDCPESILKLLSPTDNEYANEWRTKCRERAEQKKRLENLPVGTHILVHSNGAEWTSGHKGDLELVKRNEGRTGWQEYHSYHYVGKPTILASGYDIVKPKATQYCLW